MPFLTLHVNHGPERSPRCGLTQSNMNFEFELEALQKAFQLFELVDRQTGLQLKTSLAATFCFLSDIQYPGASSGTYTW